jgi:hypothetical protein
MDRAKLWSRGSLSPLEIYKAEGDLPPQLGFRVVLSEYLDSCDTGAGARELESGRVAVLYLQEPALTSESFNYCSRTGLLQPDYENSLDVRHLRSLFPHGG